MANRPALRFTRVILRNWRNFRAADVRLRERAFLVGPNASGKSNFLDALKFLRDLARPTGGGLAAAIAERGDFKAIRCLHARGQSAVEIEVFVGDDEEPERWGYKLVIQRVGREKQATVASEIVTSNGEVIDRLERPQDAGDHLIYTQTKLQQVGQNGSFRELADFFASIRFLHVVPQIVRDRRRHLATGDDPHGGDLLRRIKDMSEKSRRPRLRRLEAALKIAVPQMVDLRLEDDPDGKPHLLVTFTHWRGQGAKQNEEQFSDGTLRLLGLLWSLTESGGPLLLEEPELSLHDAVVQHLPAMMRRAQGMSGRQVIASTHSRAIIDAPGVGLADVHRIAVGDNGSVIETASDNAEVEEQVREHGWPLSDALLPLTAPRGVEKLAGLNVLGG